MITLSGERQRRFDELLEWFFANEAPNSFKEVIDLEKRIVRILDGEEPDPSERVRREPVYGPYQG
jgi:hypothetical protein